MCSPFITSAGDYVASVGLDDDHSMAIYHWGQKRLVASGPTDKGKVLGLSFLSPAGLTVPGKGSGSSSNNNSKVVKATPCGTECDRLVTCGESHIKFWQINGRNLNCQKGVFGSGTQGKQTMTGVVSMAQLAVSTGADGALFIWDEHRLVVSVPSPFLLGRFRNGQYVIGVLNFLDVSTD